MPTGVQSERVASPTFHATLLFSIFVFLAVLVMSFIFKVEVVARGTGKVIPLSRVQIVQSEFAGRIMAIHVRNGSSVRKGEILVELDPTEVNSQLAGLTHEKERLWIEAARIVAMKQALALDLTNPGLLKEGGSLLKLPPSLSDHPFAMEQKELLVAELDDTATALRQRNSQLEVILRSETVTGATIARLDSVIAIQQERLDASRKLLGSGAVSRSAFLDVQQAFTELERERDVHLRELDQRSAERAVVEIERKRVITEIRSRLARRSAEVDSRLATLKEDERVALRRIGSTKIEAPASGVVDQLHTFTIGGIVEDGTELLRIVPSDSKLEIEGVFSNQDAGFLSVGQKANIRLDAYPSERFGFMTGEVADVAADSLQSRDGEWGYTVRIAPAGTFIDAGGTRYVMRPGMTATIDVITDKRSIISYFYAPILETLQSSLGER